MLLQGIVSGLLAGGVYAMIALGMALIFGVMRVINVAHGTLLMLGGYTTYWLFSLYGLNPFFSLLVSFPLLFLVDLLLQRFFVSMTFATDSCSRTVTKHCTKERDRSAGLWTRRHLRAPVMVAKSAGRARAVRP